MRESVHFRDCRRIIEGIKSGPILSPILFPFGPLLLDSGNIGTEDTLAVIILVIFMLLLIPVLRWRFRQLDRKMRESYSPDSYFSDNFGAEAEQSSPADFSSIEAREEPSASGDFGLNAQWNEPIMSFEEYARDFHRRLMGLAAVFILIGAISAFEGYGILKDGNLTKGIFFLLSGLFVMLSSLFIPSIGDQNLRTLRDNDGYLNVRAFLATTDLSAPEVVKKFLVENGYSYELKEKDKQQSMEKKYVLDSGNYINVVLVSMMMRPNTYSGWIEIGYKFSNYRESRELQQELDAYLTEHGILKRSH